MSFVAPVLKALMQKGLTRKQAKEVFNAAGHPRVPRPDGVSRPLARFLVRKARTTPYGMAFDEKITQSYKMWHHLQAKRYPHHH